jgi:hypothetical protein
MRQNANSRPGEERPRSNYTHRYGFYHNTTRTDNAGERIAGTSYRLPRCAASADNDRRLFNIDIGDMTPGQLWAERRRVADALAVIISNHADVIMSYGPGYSMKASEWLRERLRLLEAQS